MPNDPTADDALLARLDKCLAMDAPTASDRQWTDLLGVSTEAAARIRAQAARIAKLEALISDLEVNIRQALAALTPASGVANDR